MSARNRRYEIASSGYDEYSQMLGTDPFGSNTNVGLRIPTLPTPTADLGGLQLRYLFLLASFTVGDGACVRVRGFRQLLTIGQVSTPGEGNSYVYEAQVTTPFWHFIDGNVSWHMRRCGPPNAQSIPKGTSPSIDTESYKQYWADGSALLYGPGSGVAPGKVYPNIGSYVPPNNGKPYGEPLAGGLGTFYDLRSKWTDDRAWDSLDIPVDGPETVAFFASVRQTNPSTRSAPDLDNAPWSGFPPEEQFISGMQDNNTGSPIYWRVGGALIVEEM